LPLQLFHNDPLLELLLSHNPIHFSAGNNKPKRIDYIGHALVKLF
jgi:hypothetical protein